MDPYPFISGYVVGHVWIKQDIIKELLRGIAYFHCLKQIYMQVGHARRFLRCIVRRRVCIAKPSKLRLLSLPLCLPASLPVPLCLWLIQGLDGIRTAREKPFCLFNCLIDTWFFSYTLELTEQMGKHITFKDSPWFGIAIEENIADLLWLSLMDPDSSCWNHLKKIQPLFCVTAILIHANKNLCFLVILFFLKAYRLTGYSLCCYDFPMVASLISVHIPATSTSQKSRCQEQNVYFKRRWGADTTPFLFKLYLCWCSLMLN